MLGLLARLAFFFVLFQLVRKSFRRRPSAPRPQGNPRVDPEPTPGQFDHLTPYEIEDADYEDLEG